MCVLIKLEKKVSSHFKVLIYILYSHLNKKNVQCVNDYLRNQNNVPVIWKLCLKEDNREKGFLMLSLTEVLRII